MCNLNADNIITPMRLVVFLFLLSLFVVSVSAETSRYNLSDISSTGQLNNSVTLEKVEKGDYPERNISGLEIYTGFDANFSENSTIEILFEENRTWAKNFIDNNQEYYGGPYPDYHEIKYNIAQYNIVKSDNLKYIPTNYENNSVVSSISQNGTYYLIYAAPSQKEKYIGPNEQCELYFANPEDGYERVDSCLDDEDSYEISLILWIIISFIAAFGLFKIGILTFHKFILWTLNRKMRKLKQSEQVNTEDLRNLYSSLEKAYQQNYIEAYRELKKL